MGTKPLNTCSRCGAIRRSAATTCRACKAVARFGPGTADGRLWPNVDRSGGDSACWPWTRPTSRAGYGALFLGGRRIQAHRAAWVATYGAVPKGLCVCHHCDNPACCNPTHLFLGTHADNMADMRAKGRAKVAAAKRDTAGERHPMHRLTADDVKAIRALPGSPRDIAPRFGVTRSHIGNIRAGRTWRHI